MQLTAEQQSLIDLVATRQPRIACLTGGPGTGKSTVISELVRRLQLEGRQVALAAPSGKAAQRLAQVTGRDAMTIHRMLRLRPETAQHEPLTVPVVVVDEASMIDVLLFSQLVRACFEGGGRVKTLLLVGDADQLPPVGPGQPFHDLLRATSIEVPTVRLTTVQRQALESGIVRAAYAIKAGHEPEYAPDFRLVECPEGDQVPATIWQVIQELGLHPESSQVLCPQKTLGAGVEAINRHIELVRVPGELGVPAGPMCRGKYRAGTKVIHTKNDYTLGVFNGELGFVREARPGPPGKEGKDELDVVIGEGENARELLYRGAAINMLAPAWALTVHKSQGSEWPTVIFVAHKQHTFMLSRSLLYVAVTRAKSRVVVVGDREAVARAVRKVDDACRKTLLQRWLTKREAS